MKEDENKNAAAAAEQPEDTQPMENVDTPDPQPEAGEDVERPDSPCDGEGCEAVTVIIIARDEHHGVLMARSVKQNLIGVDADIHLLTDEDLKDTDTETLADHMPYVKTERIILMTEGMVILNPVLIGDIAVIKARNAGKADLLSFNPGTPVLMHKSALQSLLGVLVEKKLLHTDVIDAYIRGCLPTNFTPLLLGDWKTDPWLLPVVSENAPQKALEEYAKWKKFMHVSPKSWSDNLVQFLEERFHEA